VYLFILAVKTGLPNLEVPIKYMSTLKELFLDELADMYDAEKRISKALPKLARAATSDELKEAFTDHLEETKEQITKLESVFEAFGEKAKGKTCKATVGILEEGNEISDDNEDSPTLNAALIAAGQKVEHYEIASYTSLIEWARLLGNNDAVDALETILAQEEAASEKLGGIAESSANEEAMSEDGEEDEAAQEGTKTKRKKAAKR
jgi:ferritin-like metal-binding protein YciE